MCKFARHVARRISRTMTSIDGGNAKVNARSMHRDQHSVFDNRGIFLVFYERDLSRVFSCLSHVSCIYATRIYVLLIGRVVRVRMRMRRDTHVMLFGNLFGPLLYRAYIICLMMIFVSKIRYANAAFARRVYRAITFENSTGRACESSRGDATVRIMSAICAVQCPLRCRVLAYTYTF